MSRDSRWKLAAGALTVGSTALLVLWRRVFRAKPDAPVRKEQLDAVGARGLTLADGRVMQYYEFGAADGRPTVFLHGMMATGRRFQRWERDFHAYGIRAICPTLPGWGLSDPVRDRQLKDYPHDIEQLMDSLGIAQFDVMGVSFGGMHAAAVAAKLPDRVLRCGLFGAHCPADLGLDVTKGMNELFRYTVHMLRVAPFLIDPLAFAVKRLASRDTRAASAQVTRTSPDFRYIKDWPEHKQRDMTDFFGDIMAESMARTHLGYSDLGRMVAGAPWGFSVSSIRCPTLIVAGTHDDSTPMAMQQMLARLIPNNRFVSYSGGHLIFNVLFPLMLREWHYFARESGSGSDAFASALSSSSWLLLPGATASAGADAVVAAGAAAAAAGAPTTAPRRPSIVNTFVTNASPRAKAAASPVVSPSDATLLFSAAAAAAAATTAVVNGAAAAVDESDHTAAGDGDADAHADAAAAAASVDVSALDEDAAADVAALAAPQTPRRTTVQLLDASRELAAE